MLREAFQKWLKKYRKCLAIIEYADAARTRLVKQCLVSWRIHTVIRVNRRRQCFIAMLFNRWRLWAEDRVEERVNDHNALIHWAMALCSKAFCKWRQSARQIKEKRRRIYSFQNHLLSPSLQARPLRNAAGLPFSISHRSPPKGSILTNRTPDQRSRVSTAHTGLETTRRHSYFDDLESTSCYGSIRSRLSSCFSANDNIYRHNQSPAVGASGTEFRVMPQPSLGPSPPISGSHGAAFYNGRLEITALLDEMTAKVEQRSSGYRCTNRYTSYAGCASDDQLYSHVL